MSDITNVGIVGAGTMGRGIAEVFATGGYKVFISDVCKDLAVTGAGQIHKGLERLVAKNKMERSTADAIMGRIIPCEKEGLKDCDLIVEAVLEIMSVKKELFCELDKQCSSDTIFATNTSSQSITELGALVGRPIIGMHFFNPAPRMKLVEVIQGLNTPVELVEKISQLCKDLGKTPVIVKDSAGFVVNRVLIPEINEAIGIFSEGVATAEGIDNAMKLGAGHPMGPLELGDLIGLDVCLQIMDTMQAETGDPKYRAVPLLRKMVRAGKLGRKTKAGFYIYEK